MSDDKWIQTPHEPYFVRATTEAREEHLFNRLQAAVRKRDAKLRKQADLDKTRPDPPAKEDSQFKSELPDEWFD
jgi:hypothetical protein